eukprot:GHVO01029237.1.p1 GENE.GHVO01029237.1~~GHVO01029237.1.p1  ORF type:complete len:631 (-),score=48.93 GHVO01029237.1:99-1967(-)
MKVRNGLILSALAFGQSTYKETYRPQFHFTPPANWMNDPNGMVADSNTQTYHLNYQYHPWGMTWGPMHWGHATSSDLIHWNLEEVELLPDEFGTIFSGGGTFISTQVQADASGLELYTSVFFYSQHCVYDPADQDTAENEPLTLDCSRSIDIPDCPLDIHYVQHQSMAFLSPGNVTGYVKYEDNPIIPAELLEDTKNIRDPKVLWIEDAWYMILANQNKMAFFRSDDLKTWTRAGSYGGDDHIPGCPDPVDCEPHQCAVWECPDLFQLPGDNGNDQWAMIVSFNPGGHPNEFGSGTTYVIGTVHTVDGQLEFVPDARWTDLLHREWVDVGLDNYAGLAWNNMPDGRVVLTGWLSNWAYGGEVPTDPWRSAMTVPREVSVVRRGTPEYAYLRTYPIGELTKLRCDQGLGRRTETVPFNIHVDPCEDSPELEGIFDLDLDAQNVDVANPDIPLEMAVIFSNEQNSITVEVRGLEVTFDRSNSSDFGMAQEFWDDEAAQRFTRTRPGVTYCEDGECPESSQAVNIRALVDKSTIEIFIDNGDLAVTMYYFPTGGLPLDTIDWVSLSDDPSPEITLNFELYGMQSIWDHDNLVIPEDPEDPKQDGASTYCALGASIMTLALWQFMM